MGALFGDGGANFAVSLSSLVLLTRFAVAGRLLAGLHVYKAQPAGKEKANGSPLPARSGKQERRLAKAAAKQQIHIEGAEQLARYRLPRSSVEGAHFYHELELLVLGGLILAFNFLLAATPLVSLKAANYKWPLWLAVGYPLLSAGALVRVELLTGGVTTRDKAYLGGLCALSTLAAVLTIDYASPAILDFRWDDAAAELGWTITTLLRKIVFSTEVPPIPVSAGAIKGIVGASAGFIAGMLAPGTARLTRSLMLTLHPPQATRQYLKPSIFATGLMQLSVALPLTGALLWVRPMAQDLFGWSDEALKVARAAYLIVITAVQLLVFRPYVQGYLNSALVEWWTHKHAITSSDPSTHMGDFIRMKVDLVNMLLCKVATELLAPAAIWGACGSVLVFALLKQQSQPPGWTWLAWPWYLHVKSPEEGPWIPTQLLTTAAGFLAWWTSLSWFVLTALVLCMHRFGLLTT